MLSTLHENLIEPSQQHYVADTITIPILQMKKLKLKRRFPFIGIETVEYTDTLLNSGTSQKPEWMHLHSLESPGLMAKKFGIPYIDPAYELVKEQVEKP